MQQPIVEGTHPSGLGGIQKIYRFDNGYGASVVCTSFSYGGPEGLWELAVIEFTGKENDKYNLIYDTPITDDVIGYLSEDNLKNLLIEIETLPKR